MAELTDDDRAILVRESCLVDAEAAARALWEHQPGWFAPDGEERGPSDWDTLALDSYLRETFLRMAHAFLRAHHLIPGEPSIPALLAAIARRWPYHTISLHHSGEGTLVEAIISEGATDASQSRWRAWYGYSPDRAVALAMSFCAAVRASEEEA